MRNVAIPSKPGQRLQSIHDPTSLLLGGAVAIPSKPGQRLQYLWLGPERTRRCSSQSLPNQVNDFNKGLLLALKSAGSHVAIPSKPGQRLQ